MIAAGTPGVPSCEWKDSSARLYVASGQRMSDGAEKHSEEQHRVYLVSSKLSLVSAILCAFPIDIRI